MSHPRGRSPSTKARAGRSATRGSNSAPPPLFAAGQAYVAFSRLTGLDGLSLDRPLAARDVIADHAANLFLERMGRPRPAVQDALF